jgi:hypothetical protein
MSHPIFRIGDEEANMHIRTSFEDVNISFRDGSGRDGSGSERGDNESSADEFDDELRGDIAQTQALNLVFLENKVEVDEWTLDDPVFCSLINQDTQVVQKPTASKIYSQCLTPWIYRTLKDLGGLPNLALNLGAPNNWPAICETVLANPTVRRFLTRFQNITPDREESVVQDCFNSLVNKVINVLDDLFPCLSEMHNSNNTTIRVGGILAQYTLDVRSKADSTFRIFDGPFLIATEIKTAKSFRVGRAVWHNKSRGAQIICALYGFNCPAFLLTPNRWKLFVETPARNGILTFPFSQDASLSQYKRSNSMAVVDDDFIRAITLCLLSRKARDAEVPAETVQATDFSYSVDQNVASTPKLTLAQTETKSEASITPVFAVGNTAAGDPIYLPVRVYADEATYAAESEMEDQENIPPRLF